MSEETNIGWCDTTVNPTSGCDGCELYLPHRPNEATCYAKQIHEGRLAHSLPEKYGRTFDVVKLIPGRMAKAAAYKDLRRTDRKGKPWLNGRPRFIFVGDMADVFSRDVPDDYLRDEVFAPMTTAHGQRHFWIVLTKRPKRMADVSRAMGGFPANCIAMTSVTSQKTADARLPHLLDVQCERIGISAEPMREPIDFKAWFSSPNRRLRWLIPGGESGTRRHDCGAAAIEDAVAQGVAAGIPTFCKQDSAPRDGDRGRLSDEAWNRKELPI